MTPSRAELHEHLVRTAIAGDVATSRENNLDHYRSLALRDPHYTFGLTFEAEWTFHDILDLMARRAGVTADPDHQEGQDVIDPARTIDAVEEMGDRIAKVLRRAAPRVVVATGHPTGLLAVHLALARFAADRGAVLLTPAEGWTYTGWPGRRRRVRYLNGVAMLEERGSFVHSHDPDPMRAMLAEERPDFVIADHGWAGAAGEAGIETVGFADSNDPALFLGEAEGKIAVTVPLDDNVLPRYYGPLTAYLLDRVNRSL
ncbi:phosphatase [Microbispora sp. RL4-1S]|uniref:Phosphatase n=1 Tax=Microbispora oryzae TaxID=2806554 RepID=A0A940WKQ0_9ACTN|nr:phosphatase [Microbispora oryzae]MBP2707296.1 phosphatase [Microbispora oryzae]